MKRETLSMIALEQVGSKYRMEAETWEGRSRSIVLDLGTAFGLLGVIMMSMRNDRIEYSTEYLGVGMVGGVIE